MLGVVVRGYLVHDVAAATFMRGIQLCLIVAVVLLRGGALVSFLWLERKA
jgi:hypothetical protein